MHASPCLDLVLPSPHCQVENCWESTHLQHRYEETHFPPKFVPKKSIQHSTSRRSLGRQQQIHQCSLPKQNTLDQSKLRSCIVSIMVSKEALVSKAVLADCRSPCHTCLCERFVHHSLLETDSRSMSSCAPSNPSVGDLLVVVLCFRSGSGCSPH